MRAACGVSSLPVLPVQGQGQHRSGIKISLSKGWD